MPAIPTVKIKDGQGGYLIINESEFDPKQHARYEGGKAEPPPSDVPQTAEARAAELEDQHTAAELKAIAKDLDIGGYSSMNKSELAKAIAEAEVAKA
ncbi:MAG: hypothetical protein F6K04_01340 [Leptolyngbya sp. SIO4C5]|nr:hypothetical protein [Leptolyngbya sp. SIO4C5]